jgi:hypothetical protein
MTLRGVKPPTWPYTPRLFGVQNAAALSAYIGLVNVEQALRVVR